MKPLLMLAVVYTMVFLQANTKAQEATITIHADQLLHTNSLYLTGACIEDVNHEIYGGLYSQMIFGESFQEPGSPSSSLVGFTSYGGSWLPTNGVLQAAAGSGPKLVYNGFNQSSGDVSVQLWFSSDAGGNAGLILQVSQAGVGADFFNGYEISLAPAGYLVLGRHVQNFTSLSQVSCSVPIGQWGEHRLHVRDQVRVLRLAGLRQVDLVADPGRGALESQVSLGVIRGADEPAGRRQAILVRPPA